jgi:hypothetical protein
MGAIRELASEQDARHAIAVQIGLEVGLLEKCESHGCIYDAMNEFALQDAYRCGESLLAQNDPLVAPFGGSRNKLHHAIDESLMGISNCCPDCFYAKKKS